MRMHWAVPIAVCVTISSVAVARAQGPDWGKNEYLLSCEPCHGTTGRGDGAAGKHLAKRPAESDETLGIERRRVSPRASL